MKYLNLEKSLAAAKSLQSCPTLCDPMTAAHQAPPPLGLSRQEHWSRLPFPSPKRESEKWKWSHSVVSDSLRPHGLQPTRLLRPWNFPGKSTGVGCHCLLPEESLSSKQTRSFANLWFWTLVCPRETWKKRETDYYEHLVLRCKLFFFLKHAYGRKNDETKKKGP